MKKAFVPLFAVLAALLAIVPFASFASANPAAKTRMPAPSTSIPVHTVPDGVLGVLTATSNNGTDLPVHTVPDGAFPALTAVVSPRPALTPVVVGPYMASQKMQHVVRSYTFGYVAPQVAYQAVKLVPEPVVFTAPVVHETEVYTAPGITYQISKDTTAPSARVAAPATVGVTNEVAEPTRPITHQHPGMVAQPQLVAADRPLATVGVTNEVAEPTRPITHQHPGMVAQPQLVDGVRPVETVTATASQLEPQPIAVKNTVPGVITQLTPIATASQLEPQPIAVKNTVPGVITQLTPIAAP